MKPKFCSLGIIDKCVLKCRMCYKWKQRDDYIDLPNLPTWYGLIDSLRVLCEKDELEIVLAGGETFLYEPIFKIIRYAADNSFKTAIASSGYMITKDIACKIGDSGLSKITLSLDSLNKEVHNSLRGNAGVFEKVMRAIDYIGEYKNIIISISTIIMDQNLEEIIEITNWVRKNDKIFSLLFLVPMQPNNTRPERHWYKNKKYSFLWPKNIEKVDQVIDTVKAIKQEDEKEGKKSNITNSLTQLEAFKRYFHNPEEFVKQGSCPLVHALHVSSSGDIYFCYNYPSIGNIKYDRIEQIWSSEKANNIRSLIKNCKKNCHFLLNCFFEE